MTATAAQLARRVGLRLRVIDEGEELSSTQLADITQAIGDLRAELLERGLCWWDAGTIPDACVAPLADWVAYEVADAFGKIGNEVKRQRAETRIAALRSSEQRPPVKAEYF